MHYRVVALVAFLLSAASAAPISTFDNSSFPAAVIAAGLNFPYSMAQASGQVVFGSSTSGFGGIGSLLAIPVSGGSVQTLVTGFAGPVTGVRLTDDGQTIIVSHGNESARQLSFYDASTLQSLGFVNFSYPGDNFVHGTGAIGLRADPTIGGAYDLFTNVGAEFGDHVGTSQVTTTGLASGTLNQATAYEFVFSRSGSTINISAVTEIASGLRNAFGFEPLPNGDLLITDNADAVGQDELNLLPAVQLGATIVNFGFFNDDPSQGCWIDRTGNPQGSGCVQPIFSPPYPLAVGATDVVAVPNGFGNLGGGYLIAFHGLQGSASTQSDILYWNPLTNQSFTFLPNQPAVGHPDTMLFLDNQHLLIGDFSQNGAVGSGGLGAGQLIEISAVPEPASFGLVVAAALVCGSLRARFTSPRS
jgi:hypothetical protein